MQSAKKPRFEFQCVVFKAYDPLRLFEEVQPDEACGPLAWEEEAEPLPLPDPFTQPSLTSRSTRQCAGDATPAP